MDDSVGILRLFHSLLRWGILLTVAVAGSAALRGYLRKAPIIIWERSLSIVAMVLCHVQLVLGLVLYVSRYKSYALVTRSGHQTAFNSGVIRYWKYEHVSIMVLAIALVTIGRMTSKRAKMESSKQLRVAIFYLLALLIMLFSIPWPGTLMGQGRMWL